MQIEVFDLAVVFIVISIEILLVTFLIIKTIIMKNDEAVAKINALTTQVGKIGTEVQKLKDIITSQGNVSPEVEAALTSLENTIKGVDDLNEDATTGG